MTKFVQIILWLLVITGFAILIIVLTSCNSGQTVPVARTIELTWTAPGDDGLIGQAAKYDGRFSTDTLQLLNNWLGCALIPNVAAMSPKASGQKDSVQFTVSLETGVTYYFAIKTADEVPNWSLISNLWSVVYADIDGPAKISDLTGKKL
jgi:hypothetical protein